MRGLFEKITDFAYYTAIMGVLGGLAWTGWQWLAVRVDIIETWIPQWAATISAFICLILAAWLMEKLVPLRAMTEYRWAYRERPLHRMRSIDQDSVLQVLIFTAAGAFLGLATGFPLVGAVLAMMLRIGLGLIGSPRLYTLLGSGRTRVIGTSALYVQDSEQVADALSSNWIKIRPAEPTDRLVVLVWRRLIRRSYLLVIALLILTASTALSGVLGQIGLVLFIVAWAVLGAGLYRCAEFSRLKLKTRAPLILVSVHGLIAALITQILWGIQNPLIDIPASICAVAWCGYQRGQPRNNTDLRIFDSGFGIAVPPGTVSYYLKGLGVTVILALIVAM